MVATSNLRPGTPAEAILLVESPPASRRRLMFVEAEPLRRARMPHDDRRKDYENPRTGSLPVDDEEP